MSLAAIVEADYLTVPSTLPLPSEIHSEADLHRAVAQLEEQMREAARKFEFERAAALRDRVRALKQRDLGALFELPANEPASALASPPAPAPDPDASAAAPAPSPDSAAAAVATATVPEAPAPQPRGKKSASRAKKHA